MPKTVTRQRRGCDLNPGHFAPESSTLTTRLPSHPTRVSQQLLINPSQQRTGRSATPPTRRTVGPRVGAGRLVSVRPSSGVLAAAARARADAVAVSLAVQPAAAVRSAVVEHEPASRAVARRPGRSATAAVGRRPQRRQRGLQHRPPSARRPPTCTHTHTHTRLTALFPGLPGWAGTRKLNQSGFY